MHDIKRVAILDDNADFLLYLEKMLETLGVESQPFSDPKAFLDHISHASSDLIFLDMVMTEKDGIQILELLAEQQCETPIVLVSASDAGVLSAAARFAEMAGLRLAGTLRKPFWRGELGNTLDAIRNTQEELGQMPPETVEQTLKDGMVTMHYQPKVDCASQCVLGLEALARLRMENGRLIHPHRFLAAVDDPELMKKLTRRVIESVLVDMNQLRFCGVKLGVSINVGLDALLQDDLPEFFNAECLRYGIPISRFTLEICDDSLANNVRAALKGATRFRLLGMGLSLDDFGAGRMNDDHLRSLPVTEIKINGDLVRSMSRDPAALAEVRRIVQLGQELDLAVIAKGVETRELMQLLLGLGCSTMQGFFIGRPVPKPGLPDWIKKWNNGTIIDEPISA